MNVPVSRRGRAKPVTGLVGPSRMSNLLPGRTPPGIHPERAESPLRDIRVAVAQFEARVKAPVNKNGDRVICPALVHILKCRFTHIHSFYIQRFAGIRKNIPKYEFLIKKLLLLVRRPDLAVHFRIPKTKKTLIQYEQIWAIICEKFEWSFIPSALDSEEFHFEPGREYKTDLRAVSLRTIPWTSTT